MKQSERPKEKQNNHERPDLSLARKRATFGPLQKKGSCISTHLCEIPSNDAYHCIPLDALPDKPSVLLPRLRAHHRQFVAMSTTTTATTAMHIVGRSLAKHRKHTPTTRTFIRAHRACRRAVRDCIPVALTTSSHQTDIYLIHLCTPMHTRVAPRARRYPPAMGRSVIIRRAWNSQHANVVAGSRSTSHECPPGRSSEPSFRSELEEHRPRVRARIDVARLFDNFSV